MMLRPILVVVTYTILIVGFSESLWISVKLLLRSAALVPPKASDIEEEESKEQESRALATRASSALIQPTNPHSKPCSSCAHNWKAYPKIVPYLSTWLSLAQSLLGATTGICGVIWAAFAIHDCPPLMHLTVVSMQIGFVLLLLASSVQTHITNNMCLKIFLIVASGVAVQIAMTCLMLRKSGSSSFKPEFGEFCTFAFDKQHYGWTRNLPMYWAIGAFFVCFFSSVSIINAAMHVRPSAATKSKRIPPAFLVLLVLVAYRGLGLLFVCSFVGVAFSTLLIALSAFGAFDVFPYWLLMWVVMSRVFAAALEARAMIDPVAHECPVWLLLLDPKRPSGFRMVVEAVMWPRLPVSVAADRVNPIPQGNVVRQMISDSTVGHENRLWDDSITIDEENYVS